MAPVEIFWKRGQEERVVQGKDGEILAMSTPAGKVTARSEIQNFEHLALVVFEVELPFGEEEEEIGDPEEPLEIFWTIEMLDGGVEVGARYVPLGAEKFKRLTERQREILQLKVDHGLTNKEIARRLKISYETVKNILHGVDPTYPGVNRRLGVSGLTEAVIEALGRGEIELRVRDEEGELTIYGRAGTELDFLLLARVDEVERRKREELRRYR